MVELEHSGRQLHRINDYIDSCIVSGVSVS